MAVLIGFATAHGSTREIAERIGARLVVAGIAVEVLPLGSTIDAASYQACVIGSAIHSQQWLPEALRFMERNASAMASIPTWLFSVGMPGALGRPFRKLAMAEEEKVVAPFKDRIQPRDHRLFSGVVSPDVIPAVGRLVFNAVGGHYGDFRDWKEIDAWAIDIAGQLSAVNTGR